MLRLLEGGKEHLKQDDQRRQELVSGSDGAAKRHEWDSDNSIIDVLKRG